MHTNRRSDWERCFAKSRAAFVSVSRVMRMKIPYLRMKEFDYIIFCRNTTMMIHYKAVFLKMVRLQIQRVRAAQVEMGQAAKSGESDFRPTANLLTGAQNPSDWCR